MLSDLIDDPQSFNVEYIQNFVVDHYEKTAYEKYSSLSPKRQGSIGELLVKRHFKFYDHSVRKSENSGHDLIVDNYKVEVKSSTALKINGNCTINHVALHKDWERCVVFVAYPIVNDYRLFWFTKGDLSSMIEEEIFTHQQGGKGGNLDDWMAEYKDLNGSLYIKEYSEWKICQDLSELEIQQKTSLTKNLQKFFVS